MMNEIKKVILNDEMYIGEGGNRKCYHHPIDLNCCIKISSQKGKRSSQREINYYKKLQKNGTSFEMIAKYLGPIETNLGHGEMYELIRDTNGEISKSLEYYLVQNDKKMNEKIEELIEKFRVYLQKEDILFSDFGLRNLLIQEENSKYRLIAIDGIGDNNQTPHLQYLKKLGLKRNIRKWNTFISEVNKISSSVASKIKPFDKE